MLLAVAEVFSEVSIKIQFLSWSFEFEVITEAPSEGVLDRLQRAEVLLKLTGLPCFVAVLTLLAHRDLMVIMVGSEAIFVA